MKSCITILLLLFSTLIIGQSTQIIIVDGDTLVNVKIKKNNRSTNIDQVTFSQGGGNWKTMTSSEVESLWDGNRYFLSSQTEEGAKLLSPMLNGILSLRFGIGEGGRKAYYLKFENQNQYVSINPHASGMSSFLNSNIDDFKSFMDDYDKDITYSQKSLGEFVSAYNEYRDPSKYTFSKFKHENQKTFGVTLGAMIGNAKFGDVKMGSSVKLRMSVLYEKYLIGPSIGFGAKMGFQGFKSEATDLRSYNINSVGLDGYMLVKLYKSPEYDINFTPGLSFDINYAGAQQVEAQFIVQTNEFNVRPISTGYFFSFSVDAAKLKKNPLRFYLEYGSNNAKFQGSTSVNQSLNGNIRQLAFGMGFLF